jgi:hypothetical protein
MVSLGIPCPFGAGLSAQGECTVLSARAAPAAGPQQLQARNSLRPASVHGPEPAVRRRHCSS